MRERRDRTELKDYIDRQQIKSAQPIVKAKKIPPTREELIEAGFEPEEVEGHKIITDEEYYAELLKDVPEEGIVPLVVTLSQEVKDAIAKEVRENIALVYGKLESHEILNILQGS